MVLVFWFEERGHGKGKKTLVGHVFFFFQRDMLYVKTKISAFIKFIRFGPA